QAEAKAAPDTKAADAAKALATGTKAFESGRTDAAVAALTTAIMSGALKNPELAKAFFYRGVAQRTQKKPGAALSDLNAAVWLRDGLSATDKAVAEDHRQALLREVAGGAGAPPAVAAAPVDSAAPVVAAATPAPAADPPPVPAPAAVEAPAQTASLFPWLTPDPPSPPVQATAEPAREPPTAPPAQAVVPAEPAASPPVEEKPLPWATAEPEANTVPEPPAVVAAAPIPADTVGEPVASVASVERGSIEPLHAEPAPPEKPLPWQTAAAAEPANSQPLPWAAGNANAPAPAPAVAPPAPPAPVATAPAPSAAPDPAPPVTPAASSTTLSDNVSSTAQTVSNAASAASATLATAGQTATQFIGSLFGGSGGVAGSPPEEQAAVAQASSTNEAPAATPVPVTWPAETKIIPAPARIETASLSKPVEEAAGKAEPASNATTRTSEPAAAQPTVIAVAQPVPEPAAPDATAAPQPAVPSATAPEATPAADVAQPAAMPGPYRLQIAAENSREEAEQTLARIVSKHKSSLKGLEPVIEEPQTGNVLFGSMGAAYRVSVGPYQTAVEPGRLCNILQPHGFDCRVVAVTP
ncbi:MAG: SPOR domain-containing protein, partial [Deltaproteobacteria bacterium]